MNFSWFTFCVWCGVCTTRPYVFGSLVAGYHIGHDYYHCWAGYFVVVVVVLIPHLEMILKLELCYGNINGV